jgi:hypothetical protein
MPRLAVLQFCLSMQQVVSDGSGGCADIHRRSHSLKSVVTGPVQEVAQRDHAGGFSSEVYCQSRSGASENAYYWVQFPASASQVGARHSKIRRAEGGARSEERQICLVQEPMRRSGRLG